MLIKRIFFFLYCNSVFFSLSKAKVKWIFIMFFEYFPCFIGIILKKEYSLKVKWSKWERLLIFFSKCSEYKVVLGVFGSFDSESIVNKVKKNSFHFIDLLRSEDRESNSKIFIFKAFIIPDFAC